MSYVAEISKYDDGSWKSFVYLNSESRAQAEAELEYWLRANEVDPERVARIGKVDLAFDRLTGRWVLTEEEEAAQDGADRFWRIVAANWSEENMRDLDALGWGQHSARAQGGGEAIEDAESF